MSCTISAPSTMSTKLLLVLVLALIGSGCTAKPTNRPSAVDTSRPQETLAPFTLAIVPSKSSADARSIAIAEKDPHEFYLVLTNISGEAQPVWETWNSWVYQTLSLEFTMSDDQKVAVSKQPGRFTMNFWSTFIIPPGEHQVLSYSTR